MGNLTDIFGKNDVSSTTKAGFKRSGLDANGGYGETPPPPPPPPPPIKDQMAEVNPRATIPHPRQEGVKITPEEYEKLNKALVERDKKYKRP
jgi:hypothetical protein